jgi:hypothetical protein
VSRFRTASNSLLLPEFGENQRILKNSRFSCPILRQSRIQGQGRGGAEGGLAIPPTLA